MNAARGILIAGNWKMNHGLCETTEFFAGFEDLIEKEFTPEARITTQEHLKQSRLQICVIPSYLALQKAQSLAKSDSKKNFYFPIQIAAQNAHWEKAGAY